MFLFRAAVRWFDLKKEVEASELIDANGWIYLRSKPPVRGDRRD